MFALSSRETLTQEINLKYHSVKESDQTSRKKKAWCESLECAIKELYPSSRLVLVGSSASGFAIEGCDVDLTLVRQGGRQVFYRLDSDVEVLRKIRDRLATRRSSVKTEVYFILISRSNRWQQDLTNAVVRTAFRSLLKLWLSNEWLWEKYKYLKLKSCEMFPAFTICQHDLQCYGSRNYYNLFPQTNSLDITWQNRVFFLLLSLFEKIK